MSSIYGDDDVLNENFDGPQELPSDDERLNEAAADAGEDDEGAAVILEPKKRMVRNPRPRLTVEMLCGTRGIHTIEDYYKDIKYRGKTYEKFDLDEIMRRLQHWAHRMYPRYQFIDVLSNIERLGKKKSLQVHMTRYRLGLLEPPRSADDDLDAVAGGEGGLAPLDEDEPFDEFDALLGEQIAMSKLVTTPHQTPRHSSSAFDDIAGSSFGGATPARPAFDYSDLAQPLPPSQPSEESPAPPTDAPKKLTAEQLARIAENRRIAQERLRLKRLQTQTPS